LNRTTTVILAGGLGNQLFQFGAAFAVGGDGEIHLDQSLGYPRMNKDGKPEISSFILPGLVSLLELKKRSWLARKCVGFNIRTHLAPKSYEKNIIARTLIKASTNMIIQFHFGRKMILEIARELGYYLIGSVKSKTLLIGYFQSYMWTDNEKIKSKILNIRLKKYSADFMLLQQKILSDDPVVLHVRRGDYLKEDGFGVLSDHYYNVALTQLSQETNIKKIWLFTDSHEAVLSSLPETFRMKTYVVPNDQISPSETLELMRYGSSYIIANSSFSWWGAYLRKNQLAPVFAPMKWFKGMDDPHQLLPPDWRIVQLHNPFAE
jgi:hypothetical protein